jgi:hypothetical protein
MTVDLTALAEGLTPPDSLSALLARLVDRQAKRDAAAAAVKQMDRELEELENLAAEQLAASGLDGCRAAGKTWWVDQTLRLSVPKDSRDAVLAAAEAEGLADELVTVNTATLKAWLTERAKRGGGDLADCSKGTAFEGLCSEYVETRLRSRVMG